MATYGKVYKGLIDCGLEAIMAGHIMQPAWTRKINPSIKDEDIMPATLSPELLQGLLRKELGFNGMIDVYKRQGILPVDLSILWNPIYNIKKAPFARRFFYVGISRPDFSKIHPASFPRMRRKYRRAGGPLPECRTPARTRPLF